MEKPKSIVYDYSAIRSKMANEPAKKPSLAPGYEVWIRETSNGDIDAMIERMRRANLLYGN